MTHPTDDHLRQRTQNETRWCGRCYRESVACICATRPNALTAAPQPAPAPADERAAMAEAMADASESCCYMSDIYRMTDALLVKGFGLRGGAEAGLREALLNIRELNMTATDEDGRRWAQSDLIEQEIVAALAAAPQPAPAPADERAAMIEVIVQADDAYDRVQGGTWAGAIADALLAAGYRKADGLADERETLAWAMVGGDGRMVGINYDRGTAQHLCNPGERVVSVAIRIVEDQPDGG